MSVVTLASGSGKIKFIGLSSDTKPTIASHAGLPEPGIGSTFLEYDTGDEYITYDGSSWSHKAENISSRLKKISQNKTIVAAGVYAANDVISESAGAGTCWTFSAMGKANGANGTIRRAKLIFSKTGATITAMAARCRLRLYNAVPTCNLNDNIANTGVLHADRAAYVGSFDFPALSVPGDSGTPEATLSLGQSNIPIDFVCAAADTALYGVLTFLDAEANETASMVATIDLLVEQN
jgi:hypothetical protein